MVISNFFIMAMENMAISNFFENMGAKNKWLLKFFIKLDDNIKQIGKKRKIFEKKLGTILVFVITIVFIKVCKIEIKAKFAVFQLLFM